MKKLRRDELSGVVKTVEEPVLGIWQILRKNWKFILLIIIAVIGVYFNALRGDFVSDDYATIPQNTEIMDFKHGLSGWMGGLINWFLAVTFGIENTLPYHLVSLLLYILILLVGFVLAEIVFKNNLVSRISVLVFAFLPIHVEGISWVSGRPYLLNTLFVLLSLLVFVYFSKTEKKKYLFWLFPLFFLTFAAEKTRSISLVLLIMLYWVSFNGDKLKKKVNLLKIVGFLAALFLLVILVLWPQIMNRIESVNSGINASESIYYNPFFQYPTAISKYLQLIFFPVDLTLYHTMYVSSAWLNWLVLGVYVVSLVWFWIKDRRYFFALAFIFVAAAPSMAPVKISWLVAERYMFLGSFGGALLIGLLAEKFWNKKYLVVSVLSILLITYAVRIFMRNIDWQTNHNLWVNTCQVSPNSHNAWNNIGDDYDKLAQLETTDDGKTKQYLNAVKGFGMSFQIKNNYADAYHNQANIFYKIGRLDLARQGYEQALVYNPNLYQTYLTLVQLDLMQNDKENLLRHLAGLNQSNPNDLQTVFLTANAYARIGMIDEAKQLAKMMYEQLPNVAEIKSFYDSLMNTPSKNLESGTEVILQ